MVDVKLGVHTADLDRALDAVRSKISAINDMQSTPTGQAHLKEFGAAGKELDELTDRAELLFDVTEKINLSVKGNAKLWKESTKTMEEAARIAQKIAKDFDVVRKARTAGGVDRDVTAATEIRNYAGQSRVDSEQVIRRQVEAEDAKVAADKQQKASFDKQQRWATNVGRFTSVIGGGMLGGGGVSAYLGSGVGSVLGSAFGPIGTAVGSALGGIAGGAIGSSLDPNMAKQLQYSELLRGIGGITGSFNDLESSIKKVTSGLLLTNLEAVGVAKEFAKTAAITGDTNDNLAKSVLTAGSFAVGYDVDPKMMANFLGNMRLYGQTKDDKGDRKLAYQIGESVARSGTMTKMDDTLRALLGYVQTQTSSNYMAADLTKFMSMFTGLTTSPYPGLNKNPTGANDVLTRADQGVRHFGIMGEASENAWLNAIGAVGVNKKGESSDLSFARHMREQGAFGNLQKAFGSGNAVYDAAVAAGDTETVKRMDKWRETLKEKNITNMTQIGLEYARQISSGSTNLEAQNIAGMFNMNSQEEAENFKRAQEYKPAIDSLDKHLAAIKMKREDVPLDKLSEYFQVSGGTFESHKKYFGNLKNIEGQLTPEQVARGELDIKRNKADDLKQLLYEAVDKGIIDPGRAAKQAELDKQNKINDALEGFVKYLTEANLAVARFADSLNEVSKKIEWWFKPL